MTGPVLRLVFSERIAYCRETGYRTPKTTLPLKVLEVFNTGERKLVEIEGFSSNSLFEVLEEWESYLKAAELDIPSSETLERPAPRPRGPSL